MSAGDIQRLLDRQAIEEVLTLYSHCIDTRDVDRLVEEVYAPDGVDDHGEGDVVGREALRAWFEEVLGHLAASAHNITNLQIEVDGDTATARSNLTAWVWTKAKHDGNPLRPADYVIVLAYVDTLQRYPVGWRIRRRELEPNGESIIGLGELPRTQTGAHALADRLRGGPGP
jgi:ketosteroid isomerase-like protein